MVCRNILQDVKTEGVEWKTLPDHSPLQGGERSIGLQQAKGSAQSADKEETHYLIGAVYCFLAIIRR
jgi:hypothetical protein